MKKILLIASVALLACACAKSSHSLMPDTNPVVNPILPIHYTGAKTHVILTDYLPQLTEQDEVTVTPSSSYAVTDFQHLEFDIEGNNVLSSLHIVFPDGETDIAVLPSLTHEQELISTGCTSSEIRFFLSEIRDCQLMAFLGDALIPSRYISFKENSDEATLHLDSLTLPKGRSFIRIYAASFSTSYNDLLIPLQDGRPITSTSDLLRQDDQSQVLYSILIDRFYNGNTDNDWHIQDPNVLPICDYMGGDLAGITDKIKEGYFTRLGISTLWISPITQNPWDAWGCYRFAPTSDNTFDNKYDVTKEHTSYSGYHGYWPILSTSIDKRLGTDDELRELLDVAHRHHMNVILDYVANHLHKDSPTYQEHPDWHTDSILPDGRRNFELWDDARLTTWFDTHLPTLDLEREEVREPMTDSALFWAENFEIDGYRHDACKHIPEAYWRSLTHKMVSRLPNRHIWMIGETYGSPDLINSYVKSGMLNAQFDFNVYFTAIHALCDDGSMADVNRVIMESVATYGAHHTMGNISGNHDQVRFASLAGGSVRFDEDGKEAGWTREIGIGDASSAYHRSLLLEMLNLTIPGVPCIYQGDEYAEVGGGDPDNRKMMRFDGLSDKEQDFREQVSRLVLLRRSCMPLLYGEYIPVESSETKLVFKRIYLGDEMLVCIDTKGESFIQHNGETVFTL